jgi:hypothetical protein
MRQLPRQRPTGYSHRSVERTELPLFHEPLDVLDGRGFAAYVGHAEHTVAAVVLVFGHQAAADVAPPIRSARILLLERQAAYATASPIRKAAFPIIFHNLLITSDPGLFRAAARRGGDHVPSLECLLEDPV